jgi:hypothetical protein
MHGWLRENTMYLQLETIWKLISRSSEGKGRRSHSSKNWTIFRISKNAAIMSEASYHRNALVQSITGKSHLVSFRLWWLDLWSVSPARKWGIDFPIMGPPWISAPVGTKKDLGECQRRKNPLIVFSSTCLVNSHFNSPNLSFTLCNFPQFIHNSLVMAAVASPLVLLNSQLHNMIISSTKVLQFMNNHC